MMPKAIYYFIDEKTHRNCGGVVSFVLKTNIIPGMGSMSVRCDKCNGHIESTLFKVPPNWWLNEKLKTVKSGFEKYRDNFYKKYSV